MIAKYIMWTLLFSIFLFSCNSSSQKDLQSKGEEDELTVLYDQVMAMHDEYMPMMGALVKHKLNMEDLKEKKAQISQSEDFAACYKLITIADEGMWNWMYKQEEYEAIESREAAFAFLRMQEKKIIKVNENIKESISCGKTYQ